MLLLILKMMMMLMMMRMVMMTRSRIRNMIKMMMLYHWVPIHSIWVSSLPNDPDFKAYRRFFFLHFTLSQTSHGFTSLQYKFSENTVEREKLLVTSNFSFSHSVFYRVREFSAIFIKFEIVVCNLCQFGRV